MSRYKIWPPHLTPYPVLFPGTTHIANPLSRLDDADLKRENTFGGPEAEFSGIVQGILYDLRQGQHHIDILGKQTLITKRKYRRMAWAIWQAGVQGGVIRPRPLDGPFGS